VGPSDTSTRARPGFPWRKLLLGSLAIIVVSGLACASFVFCLPAWLRFGMVVGECPSGTPVQTGWLSASALRRGVWGEVEVGATIHYTPDAADSDWTTALRPSGGVELTLVDAAGTRRALEPRKRWARGDASNRVADIRLPEDLPDGDYTLRAHLHTRLGDTEVEAPLPLYAPARVHVLTDRPLYEPGNVIMARSLQLRAADLTPLSGRTGTWVVEDPEGTVLLEEQRTADDWGVAPLRFPLDRDAPSGDWTVRWDSGEDSGQATVRVEPFTLPRFQVEAFAGLPFYRAGQAPTVRGRVTYASGAPVADASLDIAWSSAGAWPMPGEWAAGALPTAATTDAGGSFSLALPQIPADLLGQATLTGQIRATDPAGDSVTGAVSVLLSEDAIAADAVTELGDGLVEGFNNRLYLRATTADGHPLRDTDLRVRRAWDPGDEGISAHTDADGVAALQLDPGPAVNVVVPAVPVRPPPPVIPVRITDVRDRLTERSVRIVDQRSLDEARDRLAPCARFARSGSAVSVLLRVAASGRVRPYPDDDALYRCLGDGLAARSLPAGTERFYEVSLAVDPSDLPTIGHAVRGWPTTDAAVERALNAAVLDARGCLPLDAASGELPRRLEWRRSAGSRQVLTTWIPVGGSRLDTATLRCVEGRLADLGLPASIAPAAVDEIGVASFRVVASPRTAIARPQPTTMLGYELRVSALGDGGAELGATTLRLPPGQIPPVRLRADPILASPGDSVAIEVLRGPDFEGALPDKLTMQHQDGSAQRAELDEDSHVARFTLPADKDGWYTVAWGGAEARVFVRPRGELAVSVTPDADRHAPGDTAVLRVHTTAGDQPTQAAVALVGVDESLAQLVPLPGPDALDGLRDPVQTARPAFGSLDGQALSLGRIQGENAAAAVVLRVSQLPSPADRDRDVWVQSSDDFDPVARLTDRFYVALSALHAATRAWETDAAEGTQMDNETMAGLWDTALDRCEAEGEPVTDAYGRRLRLRWLPDDLLALTDPRAVVIDGTRLPEDVDPWIPWVREEQP